MQTTKLVLMSSALVFAALGGCGGTVKTGTSGGTGGTGAQGGATSSTQGGGGTTSSGGSGGTTSQGGGGTGGTTTQGGGGTGGTGAAGGTGGTGGTGAAGGTGGTGGSGGSGNGTTLAIHKLLLGDVNMNGMPSSTAWQQYGMNLDGKVSTAQSVDLCKPAAGAKPAAVYQDGDNGIDNSFGKNTLPILTALAADYSKQVNDAIVQGKFSVLLTIEGIDPGGTGTFFSSAVTGEITPPGLPLWNGNDVWRIRNTSLNAGDMSPLVVFPNSLVTADAAGARVWQSGVANAEIQLRLFGSGSVLRVPIHGARFSMTLSNDNKKATLGRIGGTIDTEAFIMALADLAGSFDPSLCPPSATFESIAQQIRQGQDILLDGSQDTTKTCNAISIGLGFEADAAILGMPFAEPPDPNPCK